MKAEIIKIQIEERNKILKGLEECYKKLLKIKKEKKEKLVILKDNKIIKIDPI